MCAVHGALDCARRMRTTDTIVYHFLAQRKMADQSLRPEAGLWKELSQLPFPTSEDASLNVYKARLQESKRTGSLSAKKKRNPTTGEVSDDFDWSSTVQSGVARSKTGEHTLLHYLSSYRLSPCTKRRGTTEKERARSLSVPVSKLQLMEIMSHQRNPQQKQHLATKSGSNSYSSYRRKLPELNQLSRDVIDRRRTCKSCSDVPLPQPHPFMMCRSYSVKSCKLFCKQCQ